MTTDKLFEELESLIKTKGPLNITHDEGGGGMGYCWCATLGDEWPYCDGNTLEHSLRDLVRTHRRLEKEP